jgi:acyl carrier protein
MDNTNVETGSLEDRILNLVAEESHTPRETLDRATTLIEIGDSLTRVEAMMAIEDEFEIALPDSEYDRVRSLGELIDLVDAKIRERDASKPNEFHGDAPPSP